MNPATEAEYLRQLERERLRALVAVDLEAADQLHADDFQLINPFGGVLSKAEYLGGIASGHLNYRVWEPISEIDVRMYERVAFIRYRARLHMSVAGAPGELLEFWHTDLYEQHGDRWQVVWSQATAIF